MLVAELDRRRWQILLTPKCWMKILEMVAALLAFLLCVSFDQTAMVHMKSTNLRYSISLAFPFIYKENVTVQSPPDLQIGKFEFDSTLLPSSIAFAAVTALALVMAISILTCQIVYHDGSSNELPFVKWEFFISLGIMFLLLASTGLWISSLVRLKHGVNDQIHHILGKCDQNGNCEEKLPNYVTLYLSTAFALFLSILWLSDCILIYTKMVHTIPQQIIETNLLHNVELAPIQAPAQN